MSETASKTLLVSPSYQQAIYSDSKMKEVIPHHPFIALAVLAAALLKQNHEVKVLDLNIEKEPSEALVKALQDFSPDYVGITFTTPLFFEAKKAASIIKEVRPQAIVVAGGPHATALPVNTLKETPLDIVVIGEGEESLCEIASGNDPTQIKGIAFKRDGEVIVNQRRGLLRDLDLLPFPAWHLFKIQSYRGPHLNTRANPVGYMETSRGCFSKCSFCSSRNIHGTMFRAKSPKRVVDEMEYLLSLGFREIQIMDDGFSTDMRRAKAVCDEMKRRNLKFPWQPDGGLRVDRVDRDLLHRMKEAGCYRIPFGIESGSQEVIDRIGKKIKLEQAEKAVKWAKEAGLETLTYFMLGLPGETVQTVEQTIAFAKELDPDYAKFAITIPLPGSPLFAEWSAQGHIKTENWARYHFASYEEVYDHPNLTWKTLTAYYDRAHREFYGRPRYIARRFRKSLLSGQLLKDAGAVLKTKW